MHVWVVENSTHGADWDTTYYETFKTRRDARNYCRRQNARFFPETKFRVRKYVRV